MSNPFRALINLLPARPLMVGTVVAISNGVATIGLPGGGSMQARGAASVGQRVFFRDGAIEGVAPDLTIEEIDV